MGDFPGAVRAAGAALLVAAGRPVPLRRLRRRDGRPAAARRLRRARRHLVINQRPRDGIARRTAPAYHRVAGPDDGGRPMVAQTSTLVALVALIDRLPLPAPPAGGRGHPRVYSDRLFLKALVIMVVKRLPTVPLLLAVLDQPTPEMQQLQALLRERGRYPSRRTFERRLTAIPETLSAQIA